MIADSAMTDLLSCGPVSGIIVVTQSNEVPP